MHGLYELFIQHIWYNHERIIIVRTTVKLNLYNSPEYATTLL